MQPILAFVEQGEFKKDTVPSTFIEWIYRTAESISVVRKGLYDNKKAAKVAWDRYYKLNEFRDGQISRIDPDPGCQDYTYTVTKGPLLPVTWGQGCTYNDLCPTRNCTDVCSGSPAAWTGCVATAMAQVIRYWQPANTLYGYNYASMPATSGDNEVQRLMRDIGLPNNVDMDYGCDGSGAASSRVPTSLKSSFGFTSANKLRTTLVPISG